MSDIQTLMRSANPIQDVKTDIGADELSEVLLSIQQRSSDMDVKDKRAPVSSQRGPARGSMVAAAAFAALIIVVGAVWLFAGTTTEEPPVTTPSTTEAAPPTTEPVPEEEPVSTTAPPEVTTTLEPPPDADAVALMTAFVEDVNSGAAESATAHIASPETFFSDDTSLNAISGVIVWTEYLTLMDVTLSIEECRASTGGNTRCELSYTSEVEPFWPESEPIAFTIRVAGDGLEFLSISRGLSSAALKELEFISWLNENHPEIARQVYWQADQTNARQKFTNAILEAELKRQYVELWRAEQGG